MVANGYDALSARNGMSGLTCNSAQSFFLQQSYLSRELESRL